MRSENGPFQLKTLEYDMKKDTAQATFERLKRIPLDLSRIDYNGLELEGVDLCDTPDFCDAFIAYAEFTNGIELSDDQLEELNEHSDIILEAVYADLY